MVIAQIMMGFALYLFKKGREESNTFVQSGLGSWIPDAKARFHQPDDGFRANHVLHDKIRFILGTTEARMFDPAFKTPHTGCKALSPQIVNPQFGFHFSLNQRLDLGHQVRIGQGRE